MKKLKDKGMGTYINTVFQKNTNDKWVEVEGFDKSLRQDYLLFAVLAGVRSDGTTVIPISEPRGLPIDKVDAHEPVTDKDYSNYAQYSTDDDINADTIHSWLMLNEILDYFKNPQADARKTAYMDKKTYLAWNGIGEPTLSYGHINIPKSALSVLVGTSNEHNSGSRLFVFDAVGAGSKVDVPDEFAYVKADWIIDIASELKYFKDYIQGIYDAHGDLRMLFSFD